MKFFFKTLTILFLLITVFGKAQGGYSFSTIKEHRSHQKFIQVQDGKMAYLDIGKGIPILLVHGVPTSSWLYLLSFTRLFLFFLYFLRVQN